MEQVLTVPGIDREPKREPIKSIRPVHEAFADYVLINPGCTLREMSAVFNYTPAWISTVMNSDMFQAYMAQRREGMAEAIEMDLPTKLRGAAHLATERIMEVLTKTEDSDTVIDCFDKILHRYGYAPNAKGGAQAAVVNNAQNVQNNFYLTKDQLGEARQALINSHSKEVPVLEVLTPGRETEPGPPS